MVNEGSAMRVLDLFSGIGGFSLGLERAGMETVAFCEYDDKARQVLSKHWPDVPQYNDVRTLTKGQLDNDGIKDIGLICGGYPCQPFSTAGKRQGEADDRALWKEYFRLIKEIRPTWVIAENVAGHISMGLDNVLADLESEDYAVQTFVIPACAVDAKHRRDRVWIVGHAEHNGPSPRRNKRELQGKPNRSTEAQQQSSGADRADVAHTSGDGENVIRNGRSNDNEFWIGKAEESGRDNVKHGAGSNGKDVADTVSQGFQERQSHSRILRKGRKPPARKDFELEGNQRNTSLTWPVEPNVGRVVDGCADRVDRIRMLGNGVVPQTAAKAWRTLHER